MLDEVLVSHLKQLVDKAVGFRSDHAVADQDIDCINGAIEKYGQI